MSFAFMAKTYIVCIDGTWNAPGQIDRDPITELETKAPQTNVAKVWQAFTGVPLDTERSYGTIAPLKNSPGAAMYLNGVGSQGSRGAQMIGGVTGTGTSERIRDAYRFLAERWEFGDRIFGFGFSRGAFAVRSLAGFIEYVGMPKRTSLLKEDELADLFASYRSGLPPKLSWMQECTIEFLGLWDTVGALAFGKSFNNFHRLSPTNVRKICHALALDEQRPQFKPTFFETNSVLQSVENVWFAGAHSNVGGGYVDANLSNIALFWMLRKANERGLNVLLPDIPGFKNEDVLMIRNSWQEFCNGTTRPST